ncbi:MAG: hypothetical protein K2G23_07035 [Muribaculaceae bacterium]|nr:hypothetical protein [Muribaculaceae bacterium]
MMHRILAILLLALSFGTAWAHYTLHTVVGDVKVESAGKTIAATKGQAVKATDYLIIPQGGKVEILNDLDKRVYTSIKPGKISVTKLMIEARGLASDNGANVASRMSLGRKSPKGSEKVYVEKGMVRRSLATYDPEGDMMEMDAETLGRYIASSIKDGFFSSGEDAPVSITSQRLPEGGIGFKMENTLQFPVYFNIIKLRKGDNSGVEISPLGQPAGSYVVLPSQTLSREHFPAISEDEVHLLVMANCQYDVDKVIEEIIKGLDDPSLTKDKSSSLPVYVGTL